MRRRDFLHSAGTSFAALNLPAFSNFEASHNKKKAVRFAHLTDIHVKPEKVAESGMANALHHVQSLKNKVDFIVNGGDSIWDALKEEKSKTKDQFTLFTNILKSENGLPIYHCIGNHDIWGWLTDAESQKQDRLYGKVWVVEVLQLPERYYRISKANWDIFILDSTQPNPESGYIAKLDEEQYEWLEEELGRIAKDRFICIVSHIPILSICAGLFLEKTEPNGDLKILRNLMHTDFFRLKKLFLHYPNIQLCISGHIHLQDELEYAGTRYFCNGAVSGNWWKGSFQEFPPAYAVMELYEDGNFSREMISYEKSSS